MGDYRLECLVRWAVIKKSTPPEQLERYGDNPCATPIRHTYYSSRPIASVLLNTSHIKWRAPPEDILADGRRYVIPLHMQTFSDATEVQLTFRDEQ